MKPTKYLVCFAYYGYRGTNEVRNFAHGVIHLPYPLTNKDSVDHLVSRCIDSTVAAKPDLHDIRVVLNSVFKLEA